MKVCRDCGAEKPLEDFSPSKKNSDGRVSYCRPCMRLRTARYNDTRRGGPPVQGVRANPVPEGRKWCPDCRSALPLEEFGRNRRAPDGLTSYCRPCHAARGNATRQRLYGGSREYHLRQRYGITGAEYDALVEGQGGLCALCRQRAPQHVDHDHVTGKVRGALCSGCNQGLGNFYDDPDALRAAADYVERHREQERPAPRWVALHPDAALRALDAMVMPAPRDPSRVEERLQALLSAR